VYLESIDKVANQSTGVVTRSNPDNTKAVEWLTKAANAGFTIAQVELGELHYNGREVEKNLDESERWLVMADRSNFVKAKADLMILRGVSRWEVSKLVNEQMQKDMREATRSR
jgi:TPR repeat protein